MLYFLDRLKKKFRIDFSKNTKFLFYLRGAVIYLSPQSFYRKNLKSDFYNLSKKEQEYIIDRVGYYNKLAKRINFSDGYILIDEFIKKAKKKTYFFDLLEYIKHFDYDNKLAYLFGDITTVPNKPTLLKSRPIDGDNKNSIIMKLNKIRHFIFVNDTNRFENKFDKAVWRGKCYNKHRIDFVKKYYDNFYCNIGQVNTKGDLGVPWQKKKLLLVEQLQYKFLIAIEGNDVASNLKWAMSSNSLVMMAKPKYETWFMEGRLQEGFHYVLLKNDYSDLEEKVKYYLNNIDDAKKIIGNANEYVQQFKNKKFEDIISYLVLEKYFNLAS